MNFPRIPGSKVYKNETVSALQLHRCRVEYEFHKRNKKNVGENKEWNPKFNRVSTFGVKFANTNKLA